LQSSLLMYAPHDLVNSHMARLKCTNRNMARRA
jgi:hypothetical protein